MGLNTIQLEGRGGAQHNTVGGERLGGKGRGWGSTQYSWLSVEPFSSRNSLIPRPFYKCNGLGYEAHVKNDLSNCECDSPVVVALRSLRPAVFPPHPVLPPPSPTVLFSHPLAFPPSPSHHHSHAAAASVQNSPSVVQTQERFPLYLLGSLPPTLSKN